MDSMGNCFWYKNDLKHRDERGSDGLVLPAVEFSGGGRFWYKKGLLHREDRDPKTGLVLPAVENTNGNKEWWIDGLMHREDRGQDGRVLPAMDYSDGKCGWYKNGNLHREDRDENGLMLPAVLEASGVRAWYKNGSLHREDGPAIIDKDGREFWYIDNREMKKQLHPWWRSQNEKKIIEEATECVILVKESLNNKNQSRAVVRKIVRI